CNYTLDGQPRSTNDTGTIAGYTSDTMACHADASSFFYSATCMNGSPSGQILFSTITENCAACNYTLDGQPAMTPHNGTISGYTVQNMPCGDFAGNYYVTGLCDNGVPSGMGLFSLPPDESCYGGGSSGGSGGGPTPAVCG